MQFINECRSCKISNQMFFNVMFKKEKKTKEELVMKWIKQNSGIILIGTTLDVVSNEPEAYFEPSLRGSISVKLINGYKQLTIFAEKLHHKCLTWFEIRLCELNFTFNIFRKNIVYRKLMKFFNVLTKGKYNLKCTCKR